MKNVIMYVTMAAGLTYAADQAVPEMAKASAIRRVDAGVVGTKERKASKTFSGKPEMPVVKSQGMKTSAAMPKANQPDGTVQTAVEVGAGSQKAQMVDGGKAQAAATGAKAEKVTAAGTAPATNDFLAHFISPVNGSTLSAQQTFAWTTGASVDRYALWVGSCQDCADLVDEDEGINLARTVALPTDGRRIYVSLFSYTGGLWYYVDYQFNASYGDQAIAAQMISPANGSTVTNPQTFSWQPGNHVDDYFFWMGSCFECNDMVNQDAGQNLAVTVNLPEDGRVIYVTMFSYIFGNWYYYDYQFRAPAPSATHTVRVNVTNQVGYAVNIYVNGANVGSVPAFTTAGTTLTLSSLSLSFELDQPRVGSTVLGDGMAGYWNTINQPTGTYNFTVNNVVGQDVYFVPSISNQTPQSLAVEVNGGLVAENRCNCDVPAFTNNVFTGYYRLYSNSNVRAFLSGTGYTGWYEFWGVDANGNVAPGGPLYQYVAANSGILKLTAR